MILFLPIICTLVESKTYNKTTKKRVKICNMNLVKRNFVFDFDSTLTRVEALDVLAEITLVGNPKKEEIIQEITEITNQGIDGEISFPQSLEKRIQLLNAKKSDLSLFVGETLAKRATKKNITKVYFDRGSYKYHGRVKLFAEALRKYGLEF